MELRIKEICKQKGVSIADLADRIGLKRESLSRMINGNSGTTLDTLKKIADVLEVKLTDLFEKKDSDIIGFLRIHGYLKQVTSLEDLKQLVEDIETGKI